MRLFFILVLCCLHGCILCFDDEAKERTKGNMDYHLVKLSRARNNFDKSSDLGFTEGEALYQDKIDKNVNSIHDIRDQKKLPGTKDLAYIDRKDKIQKERRTSKSRKRKIPSSPTGPSKGKMT